MISFPKSLLFISTLCVFTTFACHQEEWYKKEFSDAEKMNISKQFLGGTNYHFYQGSVTEQFVLKESFSLNPQNSDTWRYAGLSYLKRGMAKEMMHYWAKAVELNPVKWQGWRGYNYLYLYRDYKRAIGDFDATDTLTLNFTDYPQGQSVDYMRGICYFGLDDYQTAIKYFSKYIDEVISESDESWVDTYAFLYRGLTFEKLGKSETALADFDLALKYYPNLSDCLFHKSRILHKRGEYEEALRLVRKAKIFFKQGYYHQRPYIEVHEQIYLLDIELLEESILSKLKN